ncbi:replication protein P [Shewanella baltica]|uniref:replication protein P n=1 Tax=Shewanella baltica TaxID=62322 RepID=UPI00217D4EF8|nr:replication protein P [Shewanella baltica]MCS6236162.1 replication protein P [Shewanella baltica]MCS6270725.1 replication protein P [Shewanella baltica]
MTANQNASMKSLQTLIRQPLVGQGARVAQPEPTAMDMAIVDSVFSKLRVLFPVSAPRPEDEATHKGEWLKTLAAQGIASREQVQAGLNRARREQGDRQFWPTPRQFALWCQPTACDLGLPKLEAAFKEATRHYHHPDKHTWSHDVVRLAVRETGSWMFATGLEKDVLMTFERNYKVLCRRFSRGELTDVELPKALPETVTRPTEAAKAKSIIANLRANLGLKGANDGC